jgi:hypothetical protein
MARGEPVEISFGCYILSKHFYMFRKELAV